MVATPTVDLQREGGAERCNELTDLESDWETWGWVSFFYPSHWVDRCYMGLMPYEVIYYIIYYLFSNECFVALEPVAE